MHGPALYFVALPLSIFFVRFARLDFRILPPLQDADFEQKAGVRRRGPARVEDEGLQRKSAFCFILLPKYTTARAYGPCPGFSIGADSGGDVLFCLYIQRIPDFGSLLQWCLAFCSQQTAPAPRDSELSSGFLFLMGFTRKQRSGICLSVSLPTPFPSPDSILPSRVLAYTLHGRAPTFPILITAQEKQFEFALHRLGYYSFIIFQQERPWLSARQSLSTP